jgi:phosphonate degradation associated HDIG domain protein
MTNRSGWPLTVPTTATEVADYVFAIFADRGTSHYDESVTQTQHAAQSAALADAENTSATLTIAALLHDIGHLVVNEHDGTDNFLRENHKHELVAATILSRWFPPAVTAPIALHVAAKRYLVATDPAYAAGLSRASVQSLRIQGGPMDAAEITKFRGLRHAEDACRLRRWDDAAKVANRPVPPLEHYRERFESLVVFRPPPPAAT